MMNDDQLEVIVYGDSLILEGVRASLKTCADIKVIALNPPCNSVERASKRKIEHIPLHDLFITKGVSHEK
jgi:hypothetical protein